MTPDHGESSQERPLNQRIKTNRARSLLVTVAHGGTPMVRQDVQTGKLARSNGWASLGYRIQ